MLGILWLIVWATVGEAFYDDYNWYTSDDGGVNIFASDGNRFLGKNFSETLRTMAHYFSSKRDGDEEMTLSKAKTRLRMLKVFKYLGSSTDFDTVNGQSLPLAEGEKYCTMGRHTKVDCNHCTCVAGQLYMCTGAICPEPPAKSLTTVTCVEGKKRKIDSCNYCYCRNGHEFCSTKDCRHNHDTVALRGPPACTEGDQWKVKCNRCVCKDGEEYCTNKRCGIAKHKWDHVPLIFGKTGKCKKEGASRIITSPHCAECKCIDGRWRCKRGKACHNRDKRPKLLATRCKEGSSRQLDSCNKCYCRRGLEYCENKDCGSEDKNQYPPQLRNYKTCITGTRHKIDSCNYCFCSDGEEICTDYPCHITNIDGQECNPLDDFITRYIECNYCVCTKSDYESHESGYVRWYWRCSDNQCDSEQEIEHDDNENLLRKNGLNPPCARFETKYENCNLCKCIGRQWMCTITHECKGPKGAQKLAKISVPEADDAKWRFYNEPCEQFSKEEMDCHACLCDNGKWFCVHLDNCNYQPPIEINLYGSNSKSIEDSQSSEQNENAVAISLKSNCKQGQKKWVDCHMCVCFGRSSDHGLWLCEISSSCDETSNENTNKHHTALRTDKTKCRPGERYRFDACNFCACGAEGFMKCSHNKCDHYPMNGDTYINPYGDQVTKKKCTLGSRFRVDSCNYCECNYDRVLICSKNRCPESINSLRSRPSDFECNPGDEYNINRCNRCWCTRRRIWKCTNFHCDSLHDHLTITPLLLRVNYSHCIEGTKRQLNPCNFCLCYNGIEFCTRNPCPMGLSNAMFTSESRPECSPNEPVPAPDPCNICVCVNSEIRCTDFPCVQKRSVKTDKRSGKCVERHKYTLSDGCNYCICQGGQEYCTARACLVADKKTKDPHATCNEGEMTTSPDRCNMCVCVQGKSICTDRTCFRNGGVTRSQFSNLNFEGKNYFGRKPDRKHKMMQGSKQKCQPGKMYTPHDYDPNCPNKCICDRNELLCTKKKCIYETEDSPHLLNSPWIALKFKQKKLLKQEICEENQPLPSEDPCNSCMCLNERKVCTIISCTDNEEASDEIASAQKNKGKVNKGNMEKTKSPFCEPFTFFSPDNNRFCRNCFCLHNGLALCLLNLCKYSKDIPHHTHQELNLICKPGEIGYPTKCVTCTCSKQGNWICTREELALCQERDCDEKDEFQMGLYTYCAGCKCSVKEWYCSIQTQECKDYSNVTCPIGTLINNPQQHCSLCLCGGEGEGVHNMCFTESKCVRQVLSHLHQRRNE